AIATDSRRHRATAGYRLMDCRRDARLFEGAGEVARREELAAGRVGRIDRGDPDQVLERADEPRVGRIPGRLVKRRRRQAAQSKPPRRPCRPRALATMPRTNPASTTTTIMAISRRA